MQRNNFYSNWLLWIFPLIVGIVQACGQPKTADIDFELLPFSAELEKAAEKPLTFDQYKALKQKYGYQLDRWMFVIMGVPPEAQGRDTICAQFFNEIAMLNKPVFKAINAHYKNYPKLNSQIENALARLSHEFPDARKFTVMPYISQFSYYNTFADTMKGRNVLGYSAEMFLNDTFSYYQSASDEFPSWLKRYVHTEQLAPALVANYLKSRYELNHNAKNMVSEAILEGKIWYSMGKLFPDIPPYRLYGYTKEEWKFLEQEEANMWNYFIRENVLFNTNFQQGYKRYFVHGEQTTGAGLPDKCPPRIGCYAGLKIVEAYAKKTGKGLKEVWEHYDASSFLQTSGYNPAR
jgi:hypothetical protein